MKKAVGELIHQRLFVLVFEVHSAIGKLNRNQAARMPHVGMHVAILCRWDSPARLEIRMADGTTTSTNTPGTKAKTKAKAATAERTKIDLSDADDLRFWTDKFGVTAVRIKDAVSSVGTSAIKVEQYLKK
ncbi:DUF3606 domain-containing protein [Pigmentiphaga aceris]|uniref:DUF3606 domain-containing protein n=1 Tax=Pigmentiphaga aceris TaxID=1940612 RepID=A0A5C0B011_9BURK|nr:DUF3606 domain-containing protein [Pigmentiphaga aceris]QEI05957.1 DUF3606 domain-containing protein [Pigmentiphaga aceris]